MARSWFALAVLLALAGSAVADSEMGRKLLKKKSKKSAAPAAQLVTVNNCLELRTEIDAFSKLAIAATPASSTKKVSKRKAKRNKRKALKNLLRKTIVLSCSGKFECSDAAAAEEKRDITLKMVGAGELTIKAADGCASGDARPRLFGGRDTFPTELIYVGVANPSNAADAGGVASLVLQNVVLDGAVLREGETKPENLRGGIFAVRAAGITLTNVDFVNTQGKSAYGGGAIYVEDSPLTFTGGKVSGAVTPGNGGAIWAEASAGGEALVVDGVTFANNVARSGAGTIAFTKSGPAAASIKVKAAFTGNKAAKCAILFTDRADVAESDKAKKDDKAGGELSVDMLGSTFENNTADDNLSFCGAAVEPFAPASLTGTPARGGKVGNYNDFAM